MIEYVWILPLLCLVSAGLTLAFGRWLPMKGAFLGLAATGWGLLHSSCLVAEALLGKLHLDPAVKGTLTWFRLSRSGRS